MQRHYPHHFYNARINFYYPYNFIISVHFVLRSATKSRKSQIKFGDNSRAARVLRSETHQIEHKMTTYSESLQGRLLQSPPEWGVQSRIFCRARAHPSDDEMLLRFTQSILVSLFCFILIFRFLARTRQVSPPLSSGGYQLLYKSRDCVHSHCTLWPARREPVLRLYSDCTLF